MRVWCVAPVGRAKRRGRVGVKGRGVDTVFSFVFSFVFFVSFIECGVGRAKLEVCFLLSFYYLYFIFV